MTLALAIPFGPVAWAQVAVSSGGTPSYSVGIAVPPGIGGMTPNLSLVYTGGGVNGPVGFGWTLTGVSLITRCAATIANDGVVAGVRYAPADRLCLDGQRLIETDVNGNPVAATPAANGALLDANGQSGTGYTEYRTQTDLYSRIRAYGMANGAVANGPLYFKVWTKAGQIYEYGAGPSSNSSTNALITPYNGSVASAWAVTRISDTVGNFIDFKYSYNNTAWGSGPTSGSPTTGHEWNLAEIQYTGNSTTGQAANNKIVFEYATRADTPGSAQDRSEAYHLGYKNVSVQRLKTVRTYVNWPSSSLGVTMPSGALVAAPSTAVEVKALKLGYELGTTTSRSRLITTQECFGTAESTCLPMTSIAYAAAPTNETYTPNAAFAASALATLQLENAAGTMGVLLGDFNGDGRTDIIRWSDTPSQNVLYTSNGDGTFTQQTAFNLTSANLFKSDGCYSSIAMDFNGDGLTDILRVAQTTSSVGAACPTPQTNLLYLSKGDGTFTAVTVPSNINLNQVASQVKATPTCPVANVVSAPTAMSATPQAASATPASSCSNIIYVYSSTQGTNFHVIDVNGDGIPDIVTSVAPAYSGQYSVPSEDSMCSTVACTHVYLGSTSGTFTELTGTNLAYHSVYGTPARFQPTRFHPYVADVDGDGLADLLVDTGVWRSLGNGNFLLLNSSLGGSCQNPIDFNGDGRTDCLNLRGPASANWLGLSDGSGNFPQVSNFNLATSGVLTPASTPVVVGSAVGAVFADLDNDGRTDIIRWADDPTQNTAYLSNGDGSFRTSTLFNLNTAAYALKKSDGSLDFQTADFTGNGDTEILRTVSTITAGSAATTNQLFVKNSVVPPEELLSVTPPSGLTSTVTMVGLANPASALGPRYATARSLTNPVPYPKMDITPPMRVVETVETASGVGNTTTKDEYAYGGLRVALDGRGLLGFLTVSEQHSAADGSPLTTTTSYLQDGAYEGLAAVTQTFDGALNASGAPTISRTTNSYCDTTSTVTPAAVTAGGTSPTPCTTTSLVMRPYLYQSFEEGWDIDANRTALPTVTTTNVFNSTGDATQITVSTTGTAVGLSQTVTKVTANSFTSNTTGDNWILGRLQTSTQTNTVPNVLASIGTSAGSAPYATATTGVYFNATWTAPTFANTAVGQSSTGVATLNNVSTGALGVTVPTASALTGTDFSFVSTTCASSLPQGASCSVTINFSPTAAVSRSGALSVQTAAGLKTVNFSASGVGPAALTLTGCSSTTPVVAPAQASMTCTVGNSGPSAASGIAYGSTLSGMSISGGPTTCAANTGNCGTVTLSSPSAVGSYSGSLTATPASGGAASASFALVVDSAPALGLASCATTTNVTTPATASMTCTVINTGQSAASGIVYASTRAGMTISAGPATCAAGSGNCGSVTVTSPTAAGTYSGSLTATPASGSAASSAFNLVVNTAASLNLSACASTTNVTAPASASMTCTVANTGQTAASGITYASSLSGMSISAGPTTCAANTSNCGTVTITSPSTANTYAGLLTATASGGVAASAGFSLVVDTPAALALSSCSSTSNVTSPATANMVCTVGNTGQTAASGIAYASSLSGTTVSAGPTSCAANTSNCGSVTVTTPTAAGTYAGTLSATPTSGAPASAAFSLTVKTPAAMTLSNCAAVTPTVAPTAASVSCVVGNSGQTAASSLTYASTVSGATISGGPTTCAASTSNCGTVTLTTPTTANAYAGTLSVTPASGGAGSASFSLNVDTPAALSLSNCASSASQTTPTPDTLSCTVGNTGQTAASGISYAATQGTVASGPTACAAGASNCGTVTLSTPTAAGTYSGTLSATPVAGSSASTGYSLTVLTQASLTLSSCSSVTPATPSAVANMTCTVGNTGQSAAASIGYASSISGMTISGGPTSCSAQNSSCGSVTLSTSTTAGTYTGTLTASPSLGGVGSASFSLAETAAAQVLSAAVSPTVTSSGTVRVGTWTVTNPNAFAVLVTGVGTITVPGAEVVSVAGTCQAGQSVAASGSCTVQMTPTPDCLPFTFKPMITTAAGTATASIAVTQPKTGAGGTCNVIAAPGN